MTVCYSAEVATARPFGFVRLLFRWRGSFYKLIMFQFIVYFTIYNTLTLIYMLALNEEHRDVYNRVGKKFGRLSGYIVGPVIFCLSFFIQQVYKRFCEHFLQMPWPDALAFLISSYVRGHDKQSRLLRRTMVRYAIASIVLALISVSERMQQVFPTMDLVVVAGFLKENELNLLRDVKPSSRHMVVLGWCASLYARARQHGKIEDTYGYNLIIDELDNIRFKCRLLILYDWVLTPLAYVHTVLLGLNSFFMAAAVAGIYRLETQQLHRAVGPTTNVGEQWGLRLLAEAVTLLQFTICAGMSATSLSLIKPFGTNDGNIEVDAIVRRHLSIAYIIVDDLFSVFPELRDPSLDRTGSDHSLDDLALVQNLEIIKARRRTRGSIFFRRPSVDLEELRQIGIVLRVSDGHQYRTSAFDWLRRIPVIGLLVPQAAAAASVSDIPTSLEAASSSSSLPNAPEVLAMRTFEFENRNALHRILSFRRLN